MKRNVYVFIILLCSVILQGCSNDEPIGFGEFTTFYWEIDYEALKDIETEKIHVSVLPQTDNDNHVEVNRNSANGNLYFPMIYLTPDFPFTITCIVTCDDESWNSRSDTLSVTYKGKKGNSLQVECVTYNGHNLNETANVKVEKTTVSFNISNQ